MAFYLQSVHSRLYLQAKGTEEGSGVPIIVDKYHGRKSQQWRYMNGKIISKLNDLVVDVHEGEKVILAERNDTASQNWAFGEDFTIANELGVVFDIARASKEPGTEIIAFKKHGGTNQQFRVVPVNKTK